MEVVLKGIESSVQDYPGRIGYWHLGIPPSGPMDDLAFRFGNILVGNSPEDAGIEIAVGLFKVRFEQVCVIAVTGAYCEPKINDELIDMWRSYRVEKGDELSLGMATKGGLRCYLAVSGGIDVPLYLNSKSTFAAGKMGGFNGRNLEIGDKLKIGTFKGDLRDYEGREVKKSLIPEYSDKWEVETMRGPQSNPEFFTEEDMEYFFSAEWKVDRNSNRLGYRLNSHDWKWAREDGGIAGLHPSNILDNGYAIGAVNVCGDQPIILTVDGPSLGGFVCNAAVIKSAMWKVGQAVPGKDVLRFKEVTYEEAIELRKKHEELFSEDSLR